VLAYVCWVFCCLGRERWAAPIMTLWLVPVLKSAQSLIGRWTLVIAGNIIGAVTTSYTLLLISRVIAA